MAGQFFICKKPPPDKLAVNNLVDHALQDYDVYFEPHATYWRSRAETAFDMADPATRKVAKQILAPRLGTLAQDKSDWKTSMRLFAFSPPETQTHRLIAWRYALNMLAASVLCKELMPPDVVVRGGRYTKTDELISPEIGYWNDQGEPLDPRVQITPSLADRLVKPYRGDKPAVWYHYQAPDDKLELFVRRTLSAEPVVSSRIDHEALTTARGGEIDYASVQTLFPYLISRE